MSISDETIKRIPFFILLRELIGSFIPGFLLLFVIYNYHNYIIIFFIENTGIVKNILDLINKNSINSLFIVITIAYVLGKLIYIISDIFLNLIFNFINKIIFHRVDKNNKTQAIKSTNATPNKDSGSDRKKYLKFLEESFFFVFYDDWLVKKVKPEELQLEASIEELQKHAMLDQKYDETTINIFFTTGIFGLVIFVIILFYQYLLFNWKIIILLLLLLFIICLPVRAKFNSILVSVTLYLSKRREEQKNQKIN